MSANVETMFYVKEKPWHGLGTRVEKALNSAQALEMSGQDWEVLRLPIFDKNGKVIEGYWANVRSSDMKILGIVGNRYTIVQNKDAYAFTDSLIGEGIEYEACGVLREGKQIWLLGKMPERYILGDKFEPYICFTNTHDGTGAVRACMTPIRVVCQNTLNCALSSAKRSWATPHRGDVMSRMDEARQTLQLADVYMDNLAKKAEELARQKMDFDAAQKALDQMFDIKENATDRQKKTVDDAKEEIMVCMLHPDLANFFYTKWAFINAVSDYVGHASPVRQTKHYEENRWGNIINGHMLLDRAMAVVSE